MLILQQCVHRGQEGVTAEMGAMLVLGLTIWHRSCRGVISAQVNSPSLHSLSLLNQHFQDRNSVQFNSRTGPLHAQGLHQLTLSWMLPRHGFRVRANPSH